MPRFGPPLGNDNAHRYNRWPLEHEEALKTCFAEGMSSSAIAAELNWRFHSQYTRNAVIGRRIRMGIKCADPKASSRRPRGAAEPKPWDMAGVSKRQYRRRQAKARGPVLASPPIAVVYPFASALNIALVDLEAGHCRWPSGVPVMFCGHPKADGSSYCPGHLHASLRHGRE